MVTSVSTKGQATIPKKLRKKYNIHPGSELEWEDNLELGGIVVYVKTKKKQPLTPFEAVDKLRGILKHTNILEEYLRDKQEEIRQEEVKWNRLFNRKK
ncbi:MAG: hypothetical protein ACD_28C00426G0004 [uncultured bacterium]|nr:MAG: hypothetical protein ACD_28C00426G0004 [uncultured bacterium]KKT76239.1 MAG: AbrB family transcription regulator [Candidatus Peregrinibacteria bacterium GW2011_GWA2_44_7]